MSSGMRTRDPSPPAGRSQPTPIGLARTAGQVGRAPARRSRVRVFARRRSTRRSGLELGPAPLSSAGALAWRRKNVRIHIPRGFAGVARAAAGAVSQSSTPRRARRVAAWRMRLQKVSSRCDWYRRSWQTLQPAAPPARKRTAQRRPQRGQTNHGRRPPRAQADHERATLTKSWPAVAPVARRTRSRWSGVEKNPVRRGGAPGRLQRKVPDQSSPAVKRQEFLTPLRH